MRSYVKFCSSFNLAPKVSQASYKVHKSRSGLPMFWLTAEKVSFFNIASFEESTVFFLSMSTLKLDHELCCTEIIPFLL